MPKKLTQAEFLAKAVAVHGVGRYDYSRVIYVNTKEVVQIICPTHGVFKQAPGNHTTAKQGCPKCGDVRGGAKGRLTLKQFMARARAIHGNKYDYSQVLYSRSSEKINIACPLHGLFNQEANSHLQGIGCPACAGVVPLTTESFIARAITVHGDKYDYSRVAYVNISAKVEILCSVHGSFFQIASQHLINKGCWKCSSTAPLTTESFVARAHAAHGEKYDYSRVVYVNRKSKVSILCPTHGHFSQAPGEHMNGSGCLSCKNDKIRLRNQSSWVEQARGKTASLYFIRLYSGDEEFFKVGVTVTNIKKRYCSYESLQGYHYEVLALHKSTNAAAIWDWEQAILETFAHLSYKPMRPFTGATECFNSADEILAIFPL